MRLERRKTVLEAEAERMYAILLARLPEHPLVASLRSQLAAADASAGDASGGISEASPERHLQRRDGDPTGGSRRTDPGAAELPGEVAPDPRRGA
jgi:hypothetical protein